MKTIETIRKVKTGIVLIIGLFLFNSSAFSQTTTTYDFGTSHVNRNASAPHIAKYFDNALDKNRSIGIEYEGQTYSFDLFHVDRRSGMMEGEMIKDDYHYSYDLIIECHAAKHVEGNLIAMDVRDIIVKQNTYNSDYRVINCKTKLRSKRAAIMVGSIATGVAAYIGAMVGLVAVSY